MSTVTKSFATKEIEKNVVDTNVTKEKIPMPRYTKMKRSEEDPKVKLAKKMLSMEIGDSFLVDLEHTKETNNKVRTQLHKAKEAAIEAGIEFPENFAFAVNMDPVSEKYVRVWRKA